jgi:hypothetical protein
MKVEFLISMVGAPDRHPGDVDVIDNAEAGRLIDAGYAMKTDKPVGRAAPEATGVVAELVETAKAAKRGIETAAGPGRGRKAPAKKPASK